jgi:hypothetical protein
MRALLIPRGSASRAPNCPRLQARRLHRPPPGRTRSLQSVAGYRPRGAWSGFPPPNNGTPAKRAPAPSPPASQVRTRRGRLQRRKGGGLDGVSLFFNRPFSVLSVFGRVVVAERVGVRRRRAPSARPRAPLSLPGIETDFYFKLQRAYDIAVWRHKRRAKNVRS